MPVTGSTQQPVPVQESATQYAVTDIVTAKDKTVSFRRIST